MSNHGLRHDLSSIKTITFDGDGTLWDFRSAMQSALDLTLRQLRLIVANEETDQLTVQKMIEIRDSVAGELGVGAVTREGFGIQLLIRPG